MFKCYEVKTNTLTFRVVAINRYFAIRKAHKKYRRQYTTNFKKFNSEKVRTVKQVH